MYLYIMKLNLHSSNAMFQATISNWRMKRSSAPIHFLQLPLYWIKFANVSSWKHGAPADNIRLLANSGHIQRSLTLGKDASNNFEDISGQIAAIILPSHGNEWHARLTVCTDLHNDLHDLCKDFSASHFLNMQNFYQSPMNCVSSCIWYLTYKVTFAPYENVFGPL